LDTSLVFGLSLFFFLLKFPISKRFRNIEGVSNTITTTGIAKRLNRLKYAYAIRLTFDECHQITQKRKAFYAFSSVISKLAIL
jgi:hypothetical protein